MTSAEQTVPSLSDDGDAAGAETMEVGGSPVIPPSSKTDNSSITPPSRKSLDMSPRLSQATEASIAKDITACQIFSADIDR